MPTQQALLSTFKSAAKLGGGQTEIGATLAPLGINPVLKKIVIINGVKHVTAVMASNPNDTFTGSGPTILAAVANCVSTRFPG
jgi:hypothetical protein